MTILTAPTRSLTGELEFAVAGWHSLTDFQRMTAAGYSRSRSDLVLKDYEGTLFTCQFANSFRMQYAGIGRRIVIVGDKYLTKSRELVDFDAELTARQIAAGGYEYEAFARDAEAERKQAVGRWLQREISRMNQGLRDARGRRFGFRDNRGTTLMMQVSGSAGDAHETTLGSGFSSTGTTLLMQSGPSSGYRAGCYFSNATIPNAATIDSASMQFYILGSFADDANLNIGFEDVDSAVDFSTNTDVNTRVTLSMTTATVSWVANGLAPSAAWVTSPDIATPLQEIVDRAGWSSGGALCTLTDPILGATKVFTARPYDHDSSLAPKLDVDYTVGGGSIIPQIMYNRRQMGVS